MVRDTGYAGRIVSLSGIPNSPGHGLRLDNKYITVTVGTADLIVQSNPQRVWCLIQNTTDQAIGIYFGNNITDLPPFVLSRYDSILINENLRWTGSITGYLAAGVNVELSIVEASVE